ncbi:MAG TPA: hypothetical protein VL283_00150 [Candidatus Baltobacteraceae bacterium]|nr:hypothetical protein [Candidatus Baltobacteraceae bacterium]
MSLFRWIRACADWVRVRILWIRTPEPLKRQASVHEAGHALAAWVLPTFGQVLRVSVLPNGATRGHTLATHTLSSPAEPEEIVHLMTMAMAGAAAECLLIGKSDAGSTDDIIGTLAWWLVGRHGMPRRTAGVIAFMLVRELASGNPARQLRAHAVIEPPISFAAARAFELLRLHRDALEKLADALRRRKTLDHAGMLKVLGPRPP